MRDSLLTFEAPLLRPKPPLSDSGMKVDADAALEGVDLKTLDAVPRPLVKKKRGLDVFDQLNDVKPVDGCVEEEITASDLDALEAGLPIECPDEMVEFVVVRRFPLLYVGLDHAGHSVTGASSTCPDDVMVGDEVVSVKVQVRAIVKPQAATRAKVGLVVVDQDQLAGSRREFGLPIGCQLCWQGLQPGRKFNRKRDAEACLTLPGGWKFSSRLMNVDREWVDVQGRVTSFVLGEGLWIAFETGEHVLISGGVDQLNRLMGSMEEGRGVKVCNCWELPTWLITDHHREYRADSISVDIVMCPIDHQ